MRVRTPAEVATELHCSERHLRKLSRDIGACHVVGKTMLLSDDNVAAILEASRPQPRPPKSPVGSIALPEGDYEKLRAMLVKALDRANPRRR